MMKIIISESHIDELVIKQLDNLFNVDDIHWTNPIEEDGETGEEYEDPTRVIFYYGDYSDEDTLFYWYDKGYWGQDYSGHNSDNFSLHKSNSPMLVIEEPYHSRLNGLFGNKWYKPFKIWFKENFELSVKTLVDEIPHTRK